MKKDNAYILLFDFVELKKAGGEPPSYPYEARLFLYDKEEKEYTGKSFYVDIETWPAVLQTARSWKKQLEHENYKYPANIKDIFVFKFKKDISIDDAMKLIHKIEFEEIKL